jgi:hypothetical protein
MVLLLLAAALCRVAARLSACNVFGTFGLSALRCKVRLQDMVVLDSLDCTIAVLCLHAQQFSRAPTLRCHVLA